MESLRLGILIFNVIFLFLSFSIIGTYFYFRYSERRISLPKKQIFATQFRFFRDGTNKNYLYLETPLPFFPQHLINIQTILGLMKKQDRKLFLADYQIFLKTKSWKQFSQPTLITFNFGNQEIKGFLQIQKEKIMHKLIARKNKIIVGSFTNLNLGK